MGYDQVRETNMATSVDWSKCPALESVPGKVSGAWVFRNTRVPVSAILENLQDLSVKEVVEEYPSVTREQVNEVLHFLAVSSETDIR